MSRIGRTPIPVPAGVEVDIKGAVVTVKGPKGSLQHTVATPIKVGRADDGSVLVLRPDDERASKELHGLTRTLVANMVTGVTRGFQKSLEIVGVGYRVIARGPALEFSLGFSQPVGVEPPEGITFQVDTPTRFHVQGIDKQQVGEVAANPRTRRKPEPYKGRGVRSQGEVIRRKVGKAGK